MPVSTAGRNFMNTVYDPDSANLTGIIAHNSVFTNYTSTDGGLTFSRYSGPTGSFPTTTDARRSVAYNNGTWIICGSDNGFFRSTDNGVTFVGCTGDRFINGSGAILGSAGPGVAAVYGNSKWVAIGQYYTSGYNRILTSIDDGVTWSAEGVTGIPTVVTSTNILKSIRYVNNRFFLSAGTDGIFTSTDGLTWTGGLTGATGGADAPCHAMEWNGSVWLCGTNLNRVLRSTDGFNWTVVAGSTGINLGSISTEMVSNGKAWMYCAAGGLAENSLFRSYNNGDNWTAIGPTGNTVSIIWTGKNWLRIGNSNITHYISSDDGDTWIPLGPTVLPNTTRYGLFKNWNKSAYYP